MKNLRGIIFLSFAMLPLLGHAQILVPEDIPTPNAASIGKYGDIPMSYFTGNAGISVPLYTFDVKGVELPLSLNYDTSGLLINSLPSWTGMNWSLQAGGVIVRQKHGYYDEQTFPSQAHVSFQRFFDNYSNLPNLLSPTTGNYQKLRNGVYGTVKDFEPDVFFFNLMGRTGKFFLGNDGNWKVQCNENIEVIFDIGNSNNYIAPFFAHYPKAGAIDSNQPKVIRGFKLRDENGTIYTFGGDNSSIEYTTDFYQMTCDEDVYSWHPISWYLTDITDKYGNTLYTFSYERGRYIAQVYNYWQYIESSYEFTFTQWLGFYKQTLSGKRWSFDRTFPYGISVSSPVYLKSIKTSNGITAKFFSTDTMSGKALYSKLYSKYPDDKLYENLARLSPKWVGKYNPDTNRSLFFNTPGAFYYLQLNYSNYNTNTYTNPTGPKKDILSYTGVRQLVRIEISSTGKSGKVFSLSYQNSPRVVLTSVTIQGAPAYAAGQNNVGCYSFKYYNLNKLPTDYLTQAADHWGYYNGKDFQYPDGYSGSWFKTQRDPQGECSKYGMMTEICYPTGGTSVIEYEPHSFSKRLSLNRQSVKDSIGTAGGVRVKSITDYEDATHSKILKKRTFTYLNPMTQKSSGELLVPPVYGWSNWLYNTKDGGETVKYHLTMFRSTSIYPLSNSCGPHIGYTYIEESYNDGSKIRYQYSNVSNAQYRDKKYDVTFTTGYPAPNDVFSERNFMRGNLLTTTYFNADGKKVRSVGFKYENQNLEKYVLASNLTPVYGSASGALYFLTGGVYRLYYPKVDAIEKNDTTFAANGNIVTQTQYFHKDRSITVNSGYKHKVDVHIVDSIKSVRGFESEKTVYTYANFDGSTPESMLHNYRFCLKPVKTARYRNGIFVDEHTIAYKKNPISIPHVGTRTDIVPDYELMRYHDGRVDTLIKYGYYTNTSHLISYKKLGEPLTFLKWDKTYNYIIMQGGAFCTSEFSLSNISDQAYMVKAVKDFMSSSGAMLTGYAYDPIGGVTAIIQPNGNVTYYNYDWYGRLSDVYDTNHTLLNHYDYNYMKKKP